MDGSVRIDVFAAIRLGADMNKSFENIEYRPFPGKDYRVAHARLSGVWHVRRCYCHGYYAKCATGADTLGYIWTRTLAEMSEALLSR